MKSSQRLKRFDLLESFNPRYVSYSAAIPLSASYSVAGTEITVNANNIGDLSSGVFGVLYSINPSPAPSNPGDYAFSVNVPGGVSTQTITIGALEGIASGNTVYILAYSNLDPLDPPDSRVYGIPTLIVSVP